MPNRKGLQEIRTNVRRRTDMENSDFCSDAEIDDYINSAWCELYDILIQKYSESYFLKSSDLTTTSGTDSYDLPDDFYKVVGVDYKADNNDYLPIQRYRFTQRIRDASYRRTAADTKYRLQGEKMFFIPTPDSAKTFRVWYIPNPRIIETTASGSPIPDSLTQSRRFRTVNPVQPNTLLRIGQNKFVVYSGVIVGDVSVPASITLIDIADTGEQDSLISVQPFFGLAVSSSGTQQLGFQVDLNGVTIVKSQGREYSRESAIPFTLFVPRQSKLVIYSLNMSSNNTQDRGVNIMGEYL